MALKQPTAYTGGLTLKRHKFAVEYLRNGRNGSKAYRDIFAPKTADPHQIVMRASKIVHHPIVQSYIRQADVLAQEAIQGAIAHYALSKERVVLELCRMGFSTMGDYIKVTSQGDPYIDISGCTPEQLSAISEIQIDDYVDGRGEDARDVKKIKIKLHDKKGSLVEICKIMGWLTPKGEDPNTPADRDAPPPIIIQFVKSNQVSVNVDNRQVTVVAP